MISQMSLFQDDKQIDKQGKLLEELIYLKTQSMHEAEFRNVYGTVEKLNAKREIFNKKVKAYVQKVKNALPDVFIS